MKIDNRIFLPFAGPFVMLGLLRAMWWLAGAEWSSPGEAAFFCSFFGVIIGFAAMIACFSEEIHLGHIAIGKPKND